MCFQHSQYFSQYILSTLSLPLERGRRPQIPCFVCLLQPNSQQKKAETLGNEKECPRPIQEGSGREGSIKRWVKKVFGHTDSDMNERNLENGASFQKNSWQGKKKKKSGECRLRLWLLDYSVEYSVTLRSMGHKAQVLVHTQSSIQRQLLFSVFTYT